MPVWLTPVLLIKVDEVACTHIATSEALNGYHGRAAARKNSLPPEGWKNVEGWHVEGMKNVDGSRMTRAVRHVPSGCAQGAATPVHSVPSSSKSNMSLPTLVLLLWWRTTGSDVSTLSVAAGAVKKTDDVEDARAGAAAARAAAALRSSERCTAARAAATRRRISELPPPGACRCCGVSPVGSADRQSGQHRMPPEAHCSL